MKPNIEDGTITEILNNVIWFTYKGDEIAWTGHGYVSLACEGSFNSLEEMDKFWEDYYEALSSSEDNY